MTADQPRSQPIRQSGKAMSSVRCPKCGRRNPSDKRYCGGCGFPMGEPETQTRKPSASYLYLTIFIFGILILAWGLWAMYNALNFQQQGLVGYSYSTGIMASSAIVLGICLAILGIVRTRKRRPSSKLPLAEVFICSSCGQENPAPSSFCNRCGRALRPRHAG